MKKYSVNDTIQLLKDVKKIRIIDSRLFIEVTKDTTRLMKSLGLRID